MTERRHNDYLPQIVVGIVVTVIGGLVLSFVQGWLRWPVIDGGGSDGTPEPTVETRVFLDKLSGPAGTRLRVSGQGFQAGETVTIRFHTEECAQTTADASGGFAEVSCRVPRDWPFKMPVSIIASGTTSVRTATAQFRVT